MQLCHKSRLEVPAGILNSFLTLRVPSTGIFEQFFETRQTTIFEKLVVYHYNLHSASVLQS
jgi:hypothetical protein